MSTNQFTFTNVLVSLIIAIAFLVSESRNAKTNDFNQKLTSMPRRYCGKDLSDTLHVLCNGMYNTMYDNSSDNSPDNSPDNSLDNSPDNSLDQEMEMPDYSFADNSPSCLSRTRVREILNRLASRLSRRVSRGIHEECCLNKCTFGDLFNYCAYP